MTPQELTPQEFLKGKGHTINAIRHPQDMSLTISEINLFDIMDEYHQAKLKLLGIPDAVGRSEQLKAFAEMVANDDLSYLKDAETLLKDFESL